MSSRRRRGAGREDEVDLTAGCEEKGVPATRGEGCRLPIGRKGRCTQA
jgi:hypothetical protein